MSRSRIRSLTFAATIVSLLLAQGSRLSAQTSRLSAQTWTSDNGDGTYSNPLFYDEFSDPDMIRVGSDFYLTGTTMHSMPGLPILHSKDLVNWDFVGYAMDKLDLGPGFRLEGGKNVYGQGIWAPSFRYHDGTYYIFSNVNGQTTQLFRSHSPAGPWTRTPMKRSLHDLSVLFDDDGKVYVVWGYRSIHLAQLDASFTDIVPGTEQQIIAPEQGVGEGLHLYKIHGKYFLTTAWYMGEMKMPTARADTITGPWEVNQNVSRGEDFGLASGNHLSPTPKKTDVNPAFNILPGNTTSGRMAIHQGGIVDTTTGEWWGFSMMDANSIGRLVTLSPVTWTDGWPYFGLPGNLGRTPRTWIKPVTGFSSAPHAPYKRNDDFSGPHLQPIWQWNHVPVDGKWSLSERRGYLRLHTLPATTLLDARDTLTQRAIGPQSTPTAELDASALKPGDIAGLALFNRPYSWIGIAKEGDALALETFNEQNGSRTHDPISSSHVWLRAECDFLRETAQFSYSLDGKTFRVVGPPFKLVYQLLTFQGIRYSLFAFNKDEQAEAGYADFNSFEVYEPHPHANTRQIPYGKSIVVQSFGTDAGRVDASGPSPSLSQGKATPLQVIHAGPGRVALMNHDRYLCVDSAGKVSMRSGQIEAASSFQWIETFTGELTLMSLANHRYLHVNVPDGSLSADSIGPQPDPKDGVRFEWSIAEAK